MSRKPLKLRPKLLEKISHSRTDIISFKFSRTDEQNEGNNYLNYKAGQYAIVDLSTTEDPEGPLRSFTLASSPTEEDSILISVRIRNTPFKQKLASLEVGDIAKFTSPLGDFVLPEDYSKPAVFLSGGIGVTPFRSMIKYATDERLPLKIVMFDSNRNEDNILYKEEFESWQNLNKNLKVVYTLTLEGQNGISSKWDGEIGRIDKNMILKYLSDDDVVNAVFYICGPPGMLNAIKNLLTTEMGVTKDRIREEEFYGYGNPGN